MNQVQENKQDKLKFILIGIGAAVLYAVMNYVKYAYFSAHISELSMAALVNFVIFLVLLFIVAQHSVQANNAVFEFKKVFQSMFLVIIVAEFGNVLMNYIYPFYIQPDFIDQFYERNVTALTTINKNMAEDQRTLILDNIKNMKTTAPNDLIMMYLKEVIFDSIFAFVIVFIIKIMNKTSTPIIVNKSM